MFANKVFFLSYLVSSSKISRAEDDAMDRSMPRDAAKLVGLSVRNGPVQDDPMDVDGPVTNGATKRKSRTSITKVNYKDNDSDSEDGAPLVRTPQVPEKSCCGADSC
ncbi:DNA topoisomerase 1 [Fusarium falciforme]|nr:DNA topoisomerase 1 [Fusarium falciforme]